MLGGRAGWRVIKEIVAVELESTVFVFLFGQKSDFILIECHPGLLVIFADNAVVSILVGMLAASRKTVPAITEAVTDDQHFVAVHHDKPGALAIFEVHPYKRPQEIVQD